MEAFAPRPRSDTSMDLSREEARMIREIAKAMQETPGVNVKMNLQGRGRYQGPTIRALVHLVHSQLYSEKPKPANTGWARRWNGKGK